MNKIESSGWLDNQFAKGFIGYFLAACFLTCKPYDEESDDWKTDAEFKTVLDIVKTWKTWKIENLVLWYLQKAIIKNVPYVRRDLLFPKCLETEHRKSEIRQRFSILALELGLGASEDNKMQEVVKKPWVSHARQVYIDLELKKSKLSQEQKARSVHSEMKKRFLDGDKNMAKRGGRSVPSAESIRRSALENWA